MKLPEVLPTFLNNDISQLNTLSQITGGYVPSNAVISGLGATLSVNDGTSHAQVVFAGVTSVNVPFGDQALIDFSFLGQSDRYKRKILGMIEPGSLTFEMVYNSTDYARLIALKGLAAAWVVTVPTDTVNSVAVTVAGVLTKVETELKNDAIIMLKCEVGLSGPEVVVAS